MPTYPAEARAVHQIAEELERLAKLLRAFPLGEGLSSRGPAPAQKLATSLHRVNARLEQAATRQQLGPAGFSAIGRDFEKIGATLEALGTTPKTKARKATTRKTRR